MNNTASPTATEARRLADIVPLDRVAAALAALMLTVAILSFRPFQPAGLEAVGDGGDIVNQLGFGSLGLLAVTCLVMLVDRRVLVALASPWWLALVGFLAIAVLNALDPAGAMRAAAFTLIAVVTMAAVLTLPRGAEGFSGVLAFAGLSAVGLSYAGLVLMPDVAIHGGGGLEPQHAGFWRGAFAHKNIAGPVMACLSFAGIYLWRRGRTVTGLLLFALAIVFVFNTGSKTTTGIVPLAILIVVLPGLVGMRFLVPAFMVLALTGAGLATLGIVFIEPLRETAQSLAPGLTYTGRTSLWEFLVGMIAERPWFGYGYESLWGTETVRGTDHPFDRPWDVRGIVHGHNGYLDLAALMGLPALAAALVAFVVMPLRDYLAVPRLSENVRLADFFMMILAFTLLNAFLESFFFRRADPVWLFFVLAALGLRLVARFPVSAGAPR